MLSDTLILTLLSLPFCYSACLNGAMLPKPNCDEYFLCVSGTYVSYTCPAGQHFSPQLSSCTTVQVANCYCKSLDDGIYRLSGCYPASTEQYVTCSSKNVATVDSCSQYFFFDSNDPKASFCTTTLSACQDVTVGFCTDRAAGNYRFPGSCSSYVTCSGSSNNGTLASCSANYVFSEVNDTCVSDRLYSINCGGATGLYISSDEVSKDIRYYARVIQPFSVLSGLTEIVANSEGKFFGAAPLLTTGYSAMPHSAYDFKSAYVLPSDSAFSFSGNPDWTLIVDLQAPSSATSFEFLDMRTNSASPTVYASLTAVFSAAFHFEFQCICSAGGTGTVTTHTTMANIDANWLLPKLSFDSASSTLSIYLDDTLHVVQSPFTCFSDCGLTAAANIVTMQIKTDTKASCLMLLTGTTAILTRLDYQDQVCPLIAQSTCSPTSEIATFDSTSVVTDATSSLTCTASPYWKATVGCTSTPIEAECEWSDYSSYHCSVENYHTTWDEYLLCYSEASDPRAIFPFNYITQLRDVSYRLKGQLEDKSTTQTIGSENTLKLLDGRFVVNQSLGFNFDSNMTISFTMVTSKGCSLAFRNGETVSFSFSLSYEPSANGTQISTKNTTTQVDCAVVPSDIRSMTLRIELNVNSDGQVEIWSNGYFVCSGVHVSNVYGDFEMRAVQSTSSDYCSISCLVLLAESSTPNMTSIMNYCDSSNLQKYYSTQLVSSWPLNVVSATSDLFGMNDVVNPSYFTYKVFEGVPSPMTNFSGVNISALTPYPNISIADSRSSISDVSDDFSLLFWLYPGSATDFLYSYASDGVTLTMKMSINTTGSVTVGILFNTGWQQFEFTNAHSLTQWHYFSFSLKYRDANTYDGILNVLNSSKSLETSQTLSVQMAATSQYITLKYIHGTTAMFMGDEAFITCASYLDRAVLASDDAIYMANLCPTISVPCNHLYSTQVGPTFSLPDPSVFDTVLDTTTSTCTSSNVTGPVFSLCIVDRNAFSPGDSCYWNLDGFECVANRTLISPPCGSAITSSSLTLDYYSTINCPVPSDPINGSVILSNPACSAGTVATFLCNSGSYLVGDTFGVCDSDGTWNVSVPQCNYVDCGNPTTYLEETFNVTTAPLPPTSTDYDSLLTVECIPGYSSYYQLSATPNVTCQLSGSWTDPEMLCQRGSCGTPAHGFYHVVVGFSYLYNDTVILKCLSGRQFSTGEIEILKRCNESLTWDPDIDLPDCVELKCQPPLIADAVSAYSPVKQNYSLGEAVTVSCQNISYQLIGEAVRTCTPSQTWSGADPICAARSCLDPGDIADGTRTISSFLLNETVTYQCDTGFNMNGTADLTCQYSGLWNNDKPTCIKLDCGHPENGTNATLSYSTTLFNDSAIYTCLDGHAVDTGDLTRHCLANQSWSGLAPVCKEIYCQSVSTSAGVSLNETAKTLYKYGDVVQFVCDNGFRWVDGSFSRSCKVDSTWSGGALTCEPKICSSPTPRAKLALYSPILTTYNFSDSVRYQCVTGYVYLSGSMKRTCLEDGSWSGIEPTCAAPPGEAPPTEVSAVVLTPTEAEGAAAIGIPVGAIFMGLLLGLILFMDILSSPKYYEFGKKRYRKAGIIKG